MAHYSPAREIAKTTSISTGKETRLGDPEINRFDRADRSPKTHLSIWLGTPRGQQLLAAWEEIRKRERLSNVQMFDWAFNEFLRVHKVGNPDFALDSWQEDPNFRADPATGRIWQQSLLDEFDDKEIDRLDRQLRSRMAEVAFNQERRRYARMNKMGLKDLRWEKR